MNDAPGRMDPRAFRNVLGQFATGVAVITAEVDGVKLGATVSSFNSVSLDPPLVLFSIARTALSLPQWRTAKALAISVLGEQQAELSNRFAKSAGAKWDRLPDRRARNGAPLPPDVMLHFEGRPYAVHDGGDHEIFVVEVTGYTQHQPGRLPLVFFCGRYQQLASLDGPSAPNDNMWLHGW